MSKNIKLISIVLFALFSFFILLKGLDKSNTYSPSIDKSKIDFNFKAKFLFSEKEVFLNELLKNEGITLILLELITKIMKIMLNNFLANLEILILI